MTGLYGFSISGSWQMEEYRSAPHPRKRDDNRYNRYGIHTEAAIHERTTASERKIPDCKRKVYGISLARNDCLSGACTRSGYSTLGRSLGFIWSRGTDLFGDLHTARGTEQTLDVYNPVNFHNSTTRFQRKMRLTSVDRKLSCGQGTHHLLSLKKRPSKG